jgi:hypothetical protein
MNRLFARHGQKKQRLSREKIDEKPNEGSLSSESEGAEGADHGLHQLWPPTVEGGLEIETKLEWV